MMQLPAGFDVAVLVNDFVSCALPFVGVAVIVGSGFLILKILRKA